MKDYLYFLMEELWTELSGDEWSCRPLLDLEMEMQLEKMEEREMEGNREKKERRKRTHWLNENPDLVCSIHVVVREDLEILKQNSKGKW